MQRRRPSHPADLHIDLRSLHDQQQQQQHASSSSQADVQTSPRTASTTARKRVTSNGFSDASPTSQRKPRQRATSSAIGIPLPDIDQATTPAEEDQAASLGPPFHLAQQSQQQQQQQPPQSHIMPSSQPVLPSFAARPGKGRPSFKMLVLVTFLAFVFLLSFFPASRDKSKAAVGAVNSYAGNAWNAAGNEWDRWTGPPNTAEQAAAAAAKATQGGGSGSGLGGWSGWGSKPSTAKASNTAVRERPALHADPSKTTRCERSFDGVRNVVQYAIMIDAGSTGSRVHVYKFNYCKDSPELEDEVFEMLRPGLSSFAGNPKGAADSLRPLLTKSLASVPKNLQSCTPIAVKATAGLRLLGPQQSGDILREVRRMLKEEYPFRLADGKGSVQEITAGHGQDSGRAVEIMEGKDEGVFAWITVNYLLGLIGPPLPGQPTNANQQTAAVMDLGGASTQIVFEPKRESGEQGMRPGEHVYELKSECTAGL